MTKYPLKIENIGENTYMLMSRGHHDFESFMDKVKEAYPNWPMGMPEHLYYKAVPTRREGYHCVYVPCSKNTRSAFPVTVTVEGYPSYFNDRRK